METANLCSCGSSWGGSWARSEGWLLTQTAVGRKANLLVKGSPGLLSHLWLLPRGLSMWSLRHFPCWLKAPRACVPRRRPGRHYCDFCHAASEDPNTGSLLLFSVLQKQVTKADPGPRGGELEPNIWREVCQRLCRHILKQKERKKEKREGSRREEENKHIWEGRYEYSAIRDVAPRVYINELISWFINNVFCVLVSPWVSLFKIWVAKS